MRSNALMAAKCRRPCHHRVAQWSGSEEAIHESRCSEMELEATVEEEGSEGNKRPCSRKPLPNQNGLFEPQAAILYCDYLSVE